MTEKQLLSARMQAVADMVTTGNRVCDVGCDHGYIPIYLVQNGLAPAVLAMDVNEGPLERAREHVLEANLSDYITLRLSNGLENYRAGEAQTVICAGMGGPLMKNILQREPEKTGSFQELILQPQSDISDFRKFLRNSNLEIVNENMIYEDGKFYQIIRAVPICLRPLSGEAVEGDAKRKEVYADTELEDCFGPVLLKRKHPVLQQFLHQEREKKNALLQQMKAGEQTTRVLERAGELESELTLIERAERMFGTGGRNGYNND